LLPLLVAPLLCVATPSARNLAEARVAEARVAEAREKTKQKGQGLNNNTKGTGATEGTGENSIFFQILKSRLYILLPIYHIKNLN
jgi:hypothetical protein